MSASDKQLLRCGFPMKRLFTAFFRDNYRRQWHSIRFAARICWGRTIRLFRRPPLPCLPDGRINLHLGCGVIDHPAFINIDMAPLPHVHYIRQIDNLNIFRDNSVDLVYACHCLEHFSHKQIPAILTEWRRVLKQGGILRLSVPDFDRLVQIYNDNHRDLDTILHPLLGSHADRFDVHKAVFNEKKLADMLMAAGFGTVGRWQPGASELTTFGDWSSKEAIINSKSHPVSLNMEAIK